MSTKALKSQLLAAVAMVLVSSIALGSSTFAWFAINSSVTATGMTVTTQVANNLFIADIAADAVALPADSAFTTSVVQASATGIIEPVSTVDGKNFFYSMTNNVKGDGSVKNEDIAYVAYAEGDTFDENYGFTIDSTSECLGYVDYVFALKAVNTGAEAYINMTKLLLSYADKTDTTSKAHRVALLAEKWNGNAFGDKTLVSILAPNNAANFDSGKAVSSAAARTSALGSVTYGGKAVLSADANATTYYRVTVRMWLEGEDTTCNNSTFQNLTNAWNLDLRFDLEATNNNAVVEIAKGQRLEIADGTYAGNTYVMVGSDYYKQGDDLTALADGEEKTAVVNAFTAANAG